jgi:hypothetical protein
MCDRTNKIRINVYKGVGMRYGEHLFMDCPGCIKPCLKGLLEG